MPRIKFGAKLNILPEFCDVPDYEKVRDMLLECEELGYHSAWVMDHLTWGRAGPLECWTTLSAMASETRKIHLGPLVTCHSFRFPSVLAKMCATFDVISGGRLEFGIGAGWKEDEYQAYGIPFLKPSVRIAQMREAVIIVKKMWTEKKPSYEGRYYQIREATCEPKPIQKPHPPVWIGGDGERLLLRVTAELANVSAFMSNIPPDSSLGKYKHKLEVLRRHCEEVGRNYDDIVKSWHGDIFIAKDEMELRRKAERFRPKDLSLKEYLEKNIAGTPEEVVDRIWEFIDIGITYFIPNVDTLRGDNRLFSERVMENFR